MTKDVKSCFLKNFKHENISANGVRKIILFSFLIKFIFWLRWQISCKNVTLKQEIHKPRHLK